MALGAGRARQRRDRAGAGIPRPRTYGAAQRRAAAVVLRWGSGPASL